MKKLILCLIVLSGFGCASREVAPVANVMSAKGMENFSADSAACDQKAADQERNLWLMGIESTEIPRLKKSAYNQCMQKKGYTGGDIKSN